MLGLLGIVLIWTAVLHSLSAERNQALQGALQETSNLSRAFEEHIVRSLAAVDQTLLYMRDSYERDPAAFDVSVWARNTQALTDLTFQISLIGRDGIVIGSNLMPGSDRIDLSDREHFRVQRDSTEDRLFVSKPVLGRVSHKWSIQLTRKIRDKDGAFDGVIVVSLDPQYLSRFYEAVDIGQQGSVALIGLDGVIRARASRAGAASSSEQVIGRSLAGGQLLSHYARDTSGTYIGRSEIDGKRRVVAYRGVRGYTLIVSVAVASDEVLATYQVHRHAYVIVAGVVSAVLLLVTALVVLRQMRLTAAREQLRASEANYAEKSRLFEITLEHMSQGIMMVDAGGQVQVLNNGAKEKLGLPGEMLTSRPTLEALLQWQWSAGEFGEDGRAVSSDLRRFVLGGGMSNEPQVYERTRPNGMALEIRSLPLLGGGFVRTYTDITQRKATEATLRAAREKADQAARAKSEFLATMSHEIRTPMSGLIGVVDLLRETSLDSDQAWMADLIHGSAKNLLAVLNDILDFSKMEAGALSIVLEPTAIGGMLDEAARPHAFEAARKGVQMVISIDPHLPERTLTDRLRLGQIVTNLLSNAVKFTAAGTIVLAAEMGESELAGSEPAAVERRLRISVQDSGIGMTPEVMSRLFTPFTQADGSTTRTYGGTGLGLCISQRLAGMLGGTLRVASQFGRGSVFTLDLPLVAAGRGPQECTAASARNTPIAGRGRALVADDDATNRWLAQRQLASLGWSVDLVEDGAAALALLGTQPYDVLLTDLHMPGLDGVALARAVRSDPDPAVRQLPIIGLTADATGAQRERCGEAGMTELAVKPVSREQLERLLSAHVPISPAVAEQALGVSGPGTSPVFDATNLSELFPPGNPDSRNWVGQYLRSTQQAERDIGDLLAVPEGATLARDALAAAAHRLAGASLSIGAVRLGEAARALEGIAAQGDLATIDACHATLLDELQRARAAIEAATVALYAAAPIPA